jgi:hypothetical protein
MMNDQLLLLANVTWPFLGLLAVVILLAWLTIKDDGKPRRHLPPAE